jgi:arginase
VTTPRPDSAGQPAWGLLGAPSSAAAHWPGIEKAPAALRAAGVMEVFRSEGISVIDHGDLPVARWRSHRPDQRPNDAARVAEGLREIDKAVCAVIDDGHRPLVLGGSAPSWSASSAPWSDEVSTPV